MRSRRRDRAFQVLLVGAFALALAARAEASDFRLGVSLGLGGAGISKTVTVDGTAVPVQKSEGPGTFALYVDYLLDESTSVAVEHARGFRLGPFSSGVSFTGLAGHWYFLAPIPTVAKASPEGSTLLIKRIAPFVGFGAGIATGEITRENDQVTSVDSSGVYAGVRFGADYPLAPGVGCRPEVVYSATLSSQGRLTEASMQFGLYLFL